MKIKFISDDDLPLNKTIEIRIATYRENNKYYLQFFSDECLYEL